MKIFKYVDVSPSDYVIRFRNGNIYKEGRGMSFSCWGREQYVIIPAIVSNIPFVADQITLENQGVEVSGFTIWKIGEPSKIYMHFDFTSDEKPILQINAFLKDVVESAIRHMVSNMTIDNVLRKRGSIILQLKKELEYISTQWGITIETIEIKNVTILSDQLFSNMQAKYRDAVKLESETSSLKTEQEIAEQKIIHKEKISLLDQDAKKKELDRKLEIETLSIKQKSEISKLNLEEQKNEKLQQSANEIKLFEQSEQNKRKMAALQLETLEAQKALEILKAEIELAKKEREVAYSKMDLDVKKESIEISNLEEKHTVLFKNLTEIAKSLKINEINVSNDNISNLIKNINTYFSSKD